MKNWIISLAVLAVLGSAIGLALAAGGAANADDDDDDGARATIRDAAGARVGTATLSEDRGGVEVRATVRGLTPGFHGFHIHSVGECVAPFTSAGGHFNLPGAGHPSHSGDMPVLLVNEDGKGEARFETDRFRISDLFDADGSAIIIHALADNYANIPTRYSASGPDATTLATGDAGGRVACGLIRGGD
jgi:Cu-Zn family superoxide dismutase